MTKYLIAGCTFALALAIGHTAPAGPTVSALPAASPAPASRNTPETFVLASADLATVGAAPRDDSSDSGDDGDDGGGE
jgi:hypothetical protein